MKKEVMEVRDVAIDKLITENLQIRVEMQEECIEDYADAYREKPEDMPPVVVFYDLAADMYFLADGFHRVAAAKRAECTKIKAEVYDGSFTKALKYALSANAKHGLRRTNADKRNAMEIAWQNRAKIFGAEKPSSRQLAAICGVSDRSAAYFLSDMKVCNLHTPFEEGAAEESETPTMLQVSHDHTEERNATTRELLTQGKDRYGVDIPEKLMSAFMSTEPKVVIRQLSAIRDLLEDRHIKGDLAFAHNVLHALRDVDAAIRAIRNGAPHCVCRMCRGTGCGSCSNLGFQTRLQYDRVPPEYKAENQ